jgi:hypothetical protein
MFIYYLQVSLKTDFRGVSIDNEILYSRKPSKFGKQYYKRLAVYGWNY